MTHQDTREELSAYLDGENADARVVQSFAQGSAMAVHYLNQLEAVSQRVRDLPPPAPSEAFVSKVVARAYGRPAGARRRWAVPLALAAAGVLVLTAWGLRAKGGDTPAKADPGGPAAASIPANSSYDEDEEILLALEQLANDGEDLSLFEGVSPMDDPLDEEVLAAETLDSLAALAWEDSYMDAYPEGGDIVPVPSLSDEELDELQHWLLLETSEGRPS